MVQMLIRSSTLHSLLVPSTVPFSVSHRHIHPVLPTSTTGNESIIAVKYKNKQAERHIRAFFFQNVFVLCRALKKRQQTSLNSVGVKYELNCQDLYHRSAMGTGNWLAFLYGIRQAASLLGNVHLDIICTDADDSQRNLILPWVMGRWWFHPTPDRNWDTACQTAWDESLLDDLRYELRRMAIALIGVPSESHPARNFVLDPVREEQLQLPMQDTPLWQNIELDEVAIHFRCGDILESTPHRNYGYARFHSLADLINISAASIGIVTLPFHSGQARKRDGRKHGRCAILVGALESVLQQRFPQAVVSIRNSPNETITLACARLIMAKQSIAAGTSTFVDMPFRAAFGTAHEIDRSKMIDSIHLFDLWKEKNGQEQILKLLSSAEIN